MRWDIRLWLEHEEQAYELRNVTHITFDERGCTVKVGDGEVVFDAHPVEAFVAECVHEPADHPSDGGA